MNEITKRSVSAKVVLPLDYQLSGQRGGEVIVLLHGFNQTGASMAEALAPALPSAALTLAANGPFPLPRISRDRTWKVGYAWYFWHSAQSRFAIDMESALTLLEAALSAEGLSDAPKRIIGFSQGGWLAPVLGARLRNVRQAIGVGCEYLPERLPLPVSFPIDAVHGTLDEVVPFDDGRLSHSRLIKAGARGEFVQATGSGHSFDPRVLDAVQSLLAGIR